MQIKAGFKYILLLKIGVGVSIGKNYINYFLIKKAVFIYIYILSYICTMVYIFIFLYFINVYNRFKL